MVLIDMTKPNNVMHVVCSLMPATHGMTPPASRRWRSQIQPTLASRKGTARGCAARSFLKGASSRQKLNNLRHKAGGVELLVHFSLTLILFAVLVPQILARQTTATDN